MNSILPYTIGERTDSSIVSVSQYSTASIAQVLGQQVSRPKDAILRRPCLLRIPVQAMDQHDINLRLLGTKDLSQPNSGNRRLCATLDSGQAGAHDDGVCAIDDWCSVKKESRESV